jgi:hypothetical protein
VPRREASETLLFLQVFAQPRRIGGWRLAAFVLFDLVKLQVDLARLDQAYATLEDDPLL